MPDHYIYKDGNGNFKIRANTLGTSFYVYTPDASGFIPGSGGTPSKVRNLDYSFDGDDILSENGTYDGTMSFTWAEPLSDGGSPITGYIIRRTSYGYDPSVSEPPDDGQSAGYIISPGVVIGDSQGPGFGDGFNNPQIVTGNITYASYSGTWNCGIYFYEIAAINANGTGEFMPTEDDGYSAMRNYDVIGGGILDMDYDGTGSPSVEVTYFAGLSPGSCDYGIGRSLVAVSGYLYTKDNVPVASGSSNTAGTVTIAPPSVGDYCYAKVVEYWAVSIDYQTSETCTNTIEDCGDVRKLIYIP